MTGRRVALLAALGLGAVSCRRPPASVPLSAAAEERAAVVLAQLPLMLAPAARRVLVIGRRGGSAESSARAHPIAALDVLDGPPAPALARGGPAYDVILLEGPIEEAALRLAAARLASGGLLAARLPASPGGTRFQDGLRGVLRHLPRATVWRVVEGEALVLASRLPPPRLDGLDRAFARPAAAARLRPLGLSYPATLLSLQALDEKSARRLAWSPRGDDGQLVGLDDRPAQLEGGGLLLGRYLASRGRPLRPREYLEILLHPRAPEERPMFRGLLEQWVRRYPTDPRGVAFLYVVEEREGRSERAARLRARLSSLKRAKRAPRRDIIVPG